MPEGDTIHKLADYLDAALRGRQVSGVRLHPAFGPSAGVRRVERVSSEGKHLFLTFDDGTQLRSHLGMYGAWHRYPHGTAWRKPRRQASIVLSTEQQDFVCFNAREVQWLRLHGFRRADQGARLGGDLIRDGLDPRELLRRIDAFAAPQTLLVDLLLDQRIAAGIGNVYKSELLFLERQPPVRPVGELDEVALLALYRLAAELLAQNVGGGARTTRFTAHGGGGLWVYGRRDRPCWRCGAPVRRGVLGVQPRSTYWCPGCQADVAPALDAQVL
ncbi:MAG: Fpg/Nei family DNA glycosylase [Thiohalocapsa sp.]|jgi:endonuclease-8|uniref:DNA-formamidopyrimidine glycosylase family protein n=1 Tax=Thiohalocapsa sp. TaxID=2497641 RepID=UPI0025F73793|nr:DNA-formamidopyrimidine glycosylase family protein [Thiohalocapsa sp.]MCG6941695.1 Fpg/Nei family DNA glycosylase [Thiohalocapsa sp.]